MDYYLPSVVGGKGRYLRRTRAKGPNSPAGAYNRPFYRYGGHIEFIRFRGHYGMPRGHEHDLIYLHQYLRALFGTIFFKFS